MTERTQTALESELRAQIRKYAHGQLTFEEFQQWLAPRRWQPYVTRDQEAARLIGAIELRFEEYASGYWSEALLRDALGALLDPAAGG